MNMRNDRPGLPDRPRLGMQLTRHKPFPISRGPRVEGTGPTMLARNLRTALSSIRGFHFGVIRSLVIAAITTVSSVKPVLKKSG